MTDARTRAREAVGETTGYSGGNYDRYADAASDVWEPLLSDLLEAYTLTVAGIPVPDRLKGIGTRTLQALGKDIVS